MRTASATTTVVELGLVLALEALCLFLGQRRLFWLAVDATGSRLLGYLLAMPGTVLHESAHYLACVILRVPAGRQVRTRDGRRARVRLFLPQRDQVTGSVILGMVPHARTDPVRGALIAIAPLLLVPALLVAIALLVAGTSDPAQLRRVLPELATWKVVLLGYLTFSCGQAAFPSAGDHVGVPFGRDRLVAYQLTPGTLRAPSDLKPASALNVSAHDCLLFLRVVLRRGRVIHEAECVTRQE